LIDLLNYLPERRKLDSQIYANKEENKRKKIDDYSTLVVRRPKRNY